MGASIAADFLGAAAPAEQPKRGIAQDFGMPAKRSAAAAPATSAGPPRFQTNDPAAMRREIAATGDPALLEVFDRQVPGYAPPAPAQAAPAVIPASAAVIPAGGEPIPGAARGAPAAAPSAAPANETWWDKLKGIGEAGLTLATGATTGAIGAIGGTIGGIAGAASTGQLGTPQGASMVEHLASEAAARETYEPRTETGKRYVRKIGQALNDSGLVAVAPLAEAQLLARAAGPAGRAVSDEMNAAFAARKAGGAPPPPRIEPTLKPAFKRVDGEWVPAQPTERAAVGTLPEVSAAAGRGHPVAFDSPPIEGGVAPAVRPDRAAVLKRVGLEDVRTSAVTGDVARAAQDFQVSKFTSEPAGLAAKAQFDAERQALVTHGERAVSKTGGTLGLDQDAVNVRGQTIAKPFDNLRTWFNNAKGELYREADARAAGAPVVKTGDIEAVLGDRSFKNSAMAQDKGNLLSAITDQLELFKENNPQGLTVAVAEDFRKWLNQNWSQSNRHVIGRVINAVDDAVAKGAGEDIYSKARAIHRLEKQTLDNPSGVAKLMDFDPQTPINRVTPYNKVPDALTSLSPDQFKNVVATLKKMPPELQPDAQAAIAEIQAHYANKLVDAGGNNKGQWNAKRVSDFMRSNNANIGAAFESNADALAMLRDLQSAGHILDFPSSYPGASAQAAQALKRGLMSGITEKAGKYVGGAVGGTMGSAFGPGGAAAGGAAGAGAGEAIGSRLGVSMGEKKALKNWQSGVTRLSDVAK